MIRLIESDVDAAKQWAGTILASLETGAPATASAMQSLPRLAELLRRFNNAEADTLADNLDAWSRNYPDGIDLGV